MTRAWLALLAACGGSTARDAPDASGSTGATSVIVTDRGQPVPGAQVFFQGSDGATVLSSVTSATGACGFDLASGFVTVLLHRDGIAQLSTFAGVRLGDELHLDLSPLGPTAVDVDVAVAPDGTAPGPYELYTSCGGGPIAVQPGINRVTLDACSGAMGVLVTRLDPDTSEPITSHFEMATAGSAISLGAAYAPVDTIAVSYVGLAPGAFASTTQLVLAPQGRLFLSFASTDAPMLRRPQTSPALLVMLASNATAPTDYDEQVVYDIAQVPATAAPLAIDMSPHLPGYTNTELDPARPPIVGAYDAATRRIVWQPRANGTATPDVVRARARFVRDGTAWTWRIVAAHGGPAMQLPTLPVLPFDLNPAATDLATVDELTSVLLPAGASYDGVRAHGFAGIDTWIAPAAGTRMIVEQRRIPE